MLGHRRSFAARLPFDVDLVGTDLDAPSAQTVRQFDAQGSHANDFIDKIRIGFWGYTMYYKYNKELPKGLRRRHWSGFGSFHHLGRFLSLTQE